MSNLLAQAIKSATRLGKMKAADDETVDDENLDDNEKEEAAEEDEKDPDAEDEEEDIDAEDDKDDKPEASAFDSALNAVRRDERARCCAIFGHDNAQGNPKLSAKLIVDGTAKSQALSLLDSVGPGAAAKTGDSLAERVRASQGGKKPGQDAGRKTGGDKQADADNALAANASRNFGQRKAAQKRIING